MPKFSGLLKGARTKKFLHLGHLLIEFLRKVLKAVGKTTQHAAEKINHALHGGSRGKGAAKAAKGSKAASKSAGMASKGSGSHLAGTGLSGTATSAAAGGAGVSISATTLAAVMVISTVALGGVGAQCWLCNQDPVTVIEESLKTPSELILPESILSSDNPISSVQDPFSKSLQSEIKEAVQIQQSNVAQTYNPSQTQSNPQTYQQSGGSSGSSNPNQPYKEQKIDYKVPENP